MVKISAAQPTIFGYKKPTPPPTQPNQKPPLPPAAAQKAPAPPRAKVIAANKAPVMPPVPQKAPPTHVPTPNKVSKEEQNIKDVKDAIKASAPSLFTPKILAAGSVALLAIAYLAYQNYTLKANLNNPPPPPPPPYSTGSGISDKYNETPENLRWTLDHRNCIDVLSYGETQFATGNQTQFVSDIFSSEASTISKLSEYFDVIKTSLGDYSNEIPKSTILGALIEHECINTLTSVEPLFPKFDPKTLLNALDAAAKAANFKVHAKLINVYESLKANNPSIPSLPSFDKYLHLSDSQPEILTVKIDLSKQKAKWLTPQRNNALKAFQEQISRDPRYKIEQKNRLIKIFQRSNNQPTAEVKRSAEQTLQLIQSSNPKLASELYNDPELHNDFVKYGIDFNETESLGIEG